jgi:hypothetical protein
VADIDEESLSLLQKHKFALYHVSMCESLCYFRETTGEEHGFCYYVVGCRQNIQEYLTIPSVTVIFTHSTLFVCITHPYYSPFKTLAIGHFAKQALCLTPPKIVGAAI